MSEAGSVRRQAEDRLLVCLDLQRVSLRPGAADRCLVNCRRMLAHARESGWRVVHVHTRQASPAAARPIEGLEPLPTEPLVYRGGVSAFSNRTFRRLVLETPCEMVVIGCSGLATALVAHDEEVSITLVEDAAPEPLDPGGRYALEVLSRRSGRRFVRVTSTGALLGPVRLLRVV